jgi:hypothetical protein
MGGSIFAQVLSVARPGTRIPKPGTKSIYAVKGLGKRRGESALIYTIPSRDQQKMSHEKGITASEWEKAHNSLVTTGKFTRQWFKANLPGCEAEGTCNFTTIGGVFVLLGIAKYAARGQYQRIPSSP